MTPLATKYSLKLKILWVMDVVRLVPSGFLFPLHTNSASAAARGHIFPLITVSSTCSDHSGAVAPITWAASVEVRFVVKS